MAMIISLTYLFCCILLSTNCTQTFEFMGATTSNSNNATIWIVENVDGECYQSKLVQISIADTNCFCAESNFEGYGKTQSFRKAFKELHLLPQFELNHSDGLFRYSQRIDFTIEQADYDNAMLARSFVDGVRKYPLPINTPIFSGVKARLLYSYPSGLYVNYAIDRAIFLPTQRLLVVFTKSPYLAVGGDTMQGILVFKILIN